MAEEREFKIPMNFSELVFRSIVEIQSPQSRDEFIYRLNRFEEILKSFADEEFNNEFSAARDSIFKDVDSEKYESDLSYRQEINYKLARRIFPLLIALAQRLSLIEFETKEEKRVIK